MHLILTPAPVSGHHVKSLPSHRRELDVAKGGHPLGLNACLNPLDCHSTKQRGSLRHLDYTLRCLKLDEINPIYATHMDVLF